jgi:2-dehydro-3-deoxygalactonokinase
VHEVQTDRGIKSMYDLWLASGTDRTTFYLQYVQEVLQGLGQGHDLPIVISGMASSSIGMVELPYAPLPFSCQGERLNIQLIDNSLSMEVYLISGVASTDDVMRGEETQLIGVYESAKPGKKVCYIFPGTHSKHIFCQNNQVIAFQTYMTGEIFETIRKHTILKESIIEGNLDEANERAFVLGVLDASSENLLHSLFKIRATQILKTSEKSENNFYLSGLLIGHEMAALKTQSVESVYLCAQHDLYTLYALAAGTLGISLSTLTKPVEQATILGQLKILSFITERQ